MEPDLCTLLGEPHWPVPVTPLNLRFLGTVQRTGPVDIYVDDDGDYIVVGEGAAVVPAVIRKGWLSIGWPEVAWLARWLEGRS